MNVIKNITKKLAHLWLLLWNHKPPGLYILGLTLIVFSFTALPIGYVLIRSLAEDIDKWVVLFNERIPVLMSNTLLLTAAVTLIGTIIGFSLAFLIERSDLPLKKYWRWLVAIPLMVPPYVGALSYIIIFLNLPFSIYNFWGTTFVLSIFTFPYVYLIVGSGFRKLNLNFEEAARSMGLGPGRILSKVIIPLLVPSILAGATLISLYVLGDFGAVSMLRFDTFASTIYFQIRGSLDRANAAILSTVLITITIMVLFLESRFKKGRSYHQDSGNYRRPTIIKLGKLKILALIYVILIFSAGVLVPVGVLFHWSIRGIREGALGIEFFEYTFNSLLVAGSAALLAAFFTLPVVYLRARHPGILSSFMNRFIYAGYSLPGVIIGLGIIFIFNRFFPWLYATPLMVILAYIIRFLPQNLQSGQAALAGLSPKTEEAAKSMGVGQFKSLWKVTFPNVAPGIMAGGALVFVSSLKELPATLLLRPPGFDTLAVRVWMEASEGFYHLAAPPALLIILVSVVPLKFMLDKY